MNTSIENFREALKLVKPIKKQEIFFRLYYDDDGNVITYSMEDLPGKYIEINAEQFAIGNRNIYIKNGKIYKKKQLSIGKLIPTEEYDGTDITVIKDKTQWKMKTYE